MHKKITVRDMSMVGLMAAMVFASTMFLSIKGIPTPTGPVMLKTANAICLLGGLLFGGWRGGLAAGFGSAIFDLMSEYAAEAPITLLRFFLFAFVCGVIAWWGRRPPSLGRAILAVVVACAFDFCFNMGKNILLLVLAGSAFGPAVAANIPKMMAAGVNILIAMPVSVLLYRLIYPRLKKGGLL